MGSIPNGFVGCLGKPLKSFNLRILWNGSSREGTSEPNIGAQAASQTSGVPTLRWNPRVYTVLRFPDYSDAHLQLEFGKSLSLGTWDMGSNDANCVPLDESLNSTGT